jgi:putative transposase
MPRSRRFDIPGIAQHLVQRGNNRQPCFFCDRDFRYYLRCLRELSREHDCQVHAYVLMTNHVHLLVTPTRSGSLARMMQSLGARYVRYINASRERTGTLWEGRYKACPVDSDRYALACIRYIELNPVRAGMVERPESYRWSSFRCNALGEKDGLITTHPSLGILAHEAGQQARRYREFVADGIADQELKAIRQHSARQRALGTLDFQEQVESATGQVARILRRGPQRGGAREDEAPFVTE